MTLNFNIEYHTNWGEEIRVCGSAPELGNRQPQQALPLHTLDGIHWTATVELQQPTDDNLHYWYQVHDEHRLIRTEWNSLPRILHIGPDSEHSTFRLMDSWKDLPEQLSFYSSAFTESILARKHRTPLPTNHKRGILIKAYAPCIDSDHCLAISGNHPLLGSWNPDMAILMSDADFPEWQVELNADILEFPLEYKFILYNLKESKAEAWETNPNRLLTASVLQEEETLVIADRYVYFDLPAWKGSGVAVPIFSLRSEQSFGIGDFGDLKRLIDWAAHTRQRVVQILPINDTTMTHTWTDSYPYNSTSVYAFHPIYADLQQMGTLADPELRAYFQERQRALNNLPTLDYESVEQAKWQYFHHIFAQEGEQTLASEGFRQFFLQNRAWLQPYAAFSYLRDTHHTADFRQWPKYSTYDAEAIDQLCQPESEHYPHIALYYYIQYHLHLQLLAASQYARSQGVILKGDIPIGISTNSVEAWTEPHYFNLNGQAGAPPDDFSVNGQNWGFPTYNWDVMEKDSYAWWMKRFQKMAEYFDAYRIDHILGFFRIWEIPSHAVHGLLGQFVPALPLSREEIESYGLPFKEAYLQPFINDSLLAALFGPHTDTVKQHYLQPITADGNYHLRPEYDTQRKVQAHFDGKNQPDDQWIRDGLYTLISNVLFVPDRNDSHRYHPRIAVQKEAFFQWLTESEQTAFNQLYEQYYYHRHNDFWQQQAMKKLPQLTQSTRMLVCGEDLGMIPNCVPWVMKDLRILSLEIQRMPKEYMQEFGRTEQYPYLSICTFSTHDMSTLRGWWEENPQQTQRYYNQILGHYGEAPATATPYICQEIVRQQLHSSSILCILSLQDWFSIDGTLRHPNAQAERINVPANSRHYWRYRMHVTLEQLMKAHSLNKTIKELVSESGRC